MTVLGYDPLIPPALLRHEFPMTAQSKRTILSAREQIVFIVHNTDANQRLMVIVGPCSVHDPTTALEYCRRLTALKEKYTDDLLIIMRSCV